MQAVALQPPLSRLFHQGTAPVSPHEASPVPSPPPPPAGPLTSYSFPSLTPHLDEPAPVSSERTSVSPEFQRPTPAHSFQSYDLVSDQVKQEGYQPRSLKTYDGARGMGGLAGPMDPVPTEYSAIGRQIFASGQSGRSGFSFSEYLSGDGPQNSSITSSGGADQDHYSMPPPPGTYSVSSAYSANASLGDGTTYPGRYQAPAQLLRRPSHQSPYPNYPPTPQSNPSHQYQWRTPAPPPSHSHSSTPNHSPSCCPPGEPHRPQQYPLPPTPGSIQYGSPYTSEGHRLGPHSYYPSYGSSAPMVVRSISGHSNTSSSTAYSEAVGPRHGRNSPYSPSQHSGSEYDGMVNPAYINPAHQAPNPGSPAPPAYFGNHPSGGHYVYGQKLNSNGGDISSLGGVGLGMAGVDLGPLTRHSAESLASRPMGGQLKKRPSGRSPVSRAIFHPTPKSMLRTDSPVSKTTVDSKGKIVKSFPGTNAPGIPTDDVFAQMPTKRSRGRRPPCTPDLGMQREADPNLRMTKEALEFSGVTKSGKPKKIFLCKVPGCGKCFKRSEHLKRHVRSIHTNEKPFQCQWPGCGKLFSRHDNLSQLRIHRSPNQSDASFSAQLEAVFGGRGTIDSLAHTAYTAPPRRAAAMRAAESNSGRTGDEESSASEGEEEGSEYE